MMILGIVAIVLIAGAALFVPAGRIDLPFFWAWLAVFGASGASTYLVLARYRPSLVAERIRPPSDRDAASRKIALPLVAAHLVVAGLDAGRFEWTSVPAWLRVVGLLLFASGYALVSWTLLTNPFASSAVRIQADRSQRVISHGPYRLVRHPMYLGVLLVCLGSGAALGSLLAAALLWPVILVFARRTLLEDRMLHQELDGYRDYAAAVRWRVVPGVF